LLKIKSFYILDYFDVLISKIIFQNKKNIIVTYFNIKIILKGNYMLNLSCMVNGYRTIINTVSWMWTWCLYPQSQLVGCVKFSIPNSSLHLLCHIVTQKEKKKINGYTNSKRKILKEGGVHILFKSWILNII